MPANITSVERKQEQSQEKFHQLVMIIEETIQRIKTALGEDPSTVGQLFSQLESSIQQQNLLISSIQTPKGVTTDSVPTRLPDESSESYTQRVKDQLTQLQAVHSKTIIELDYQRRAHQACHAEVHRLRRLLRSLLKGASAVDGKQLSYERFRQFRNKLAKKLLRYNQIVSSLNQSLREAIVERPLDSGSLRLILDSADSLAKDLAYDKSTILGLNENTLDDEQSSAVSDLHKALADEVQKQLALYDRVLELESKFTIVSSASNSDLSKEKLQEEIGSAEAFPCELLSSVNDNTTSAAKIVEDSLVDQPRQAAKELDALSVEQSEHELTTTDVKVPSESAVEQELAPSCQDIPSRKSSVAAETRELVSSQPVETDFLVDITGNKSLDNQPTAKEIDIKGDDKPKAKQNPWFIKSAVEALKAHLLEPGIEPAKNSSPPANEAKGLNDCRVDAAQARKNSNEYQPAIIQAESLDNIPAFSSNIVKPDLFGAEAEILKEFNDAVIEEFGEWPSSPSRSAPNAEIAPAIEKSINPWFAKSGTEVVKSNLITESNPASAEQKVVAEKFEDVQLNTNATATASESEPTREPSSQSLFGAFSQFANRFFTPAPLSTSEYTETAADKHEPEPEKLEAPHYCDAPQADISEFDNAYNKSHEMPAYREAPVADKQEFDEEYNDTHDPIAASEPLDLDFEQQFEPQNLFVNFESSRRPSKEFTRNFSQDEDALKATTTEFRDKILSVLPKPDQYIAAAYDQVVDGIKAAAEDHQQLMTDRDKTADTLKSSILIEIPAAVADRESERLEKTKAVEIFNQALCDISAAAAAHESRQEEQARVSALLKDSLEDLNEAVAERESRQADLASQVENFKAVLQELPSAVAAKVKDEPHVNIFDDLSEAARQPNHSFQATHSLKESEELLVEDKPTEQTSSLEPEQTEEDQSNLNSKDTETAVEISVAIKNKNQPAHSVAENFATTLKDLLSAVARKDAEKSKNLKQSEQPEPGFETNDLAPENVANERNDFHNKTEEAMENIEPKSIDPFGAVLCEISAAAARRESEKAEREKMADAFNASLESLKDAVAEREAAIADREQTAGAFKTALAEIPKVKAEREVLKEQKAKIADTFNAALDEIPLAIEERESAKAERQKTAETFNAILNDIPAALARRESQKVEQDKLVNTFEAALAEIPKEVARLESEKAEREKMADAFNASLESLKDAVAEREAAIADREQTAGAFKTALAEIPKVKAEREVLKEQKAKIADTFNAALDEIPLAIEERESAKAARKQSILSMAPSSLSRASTPLAVDDVSALEETVNASDAEGLQFKDEEIESNCCRLPENSAVNQCRSRQQSTLSMAPSNPTRASMPLAVNDASSSEENANASGTENLLNDDQSAIADEAENNVANLPASSFVNRYKSLVDRIQQSAATISDIESENASIKQRQRFGSTVSSNNNDNSIAQSRRDSIESNPFSDNHAIIEKSQPQSRRESSLPEQTANNAATRKDEKILPSPVLSENAQESAQSAKSEGEGFSAWFKPLASIFSSKNIDHQTTPPSNNEDNNDSECDAKAIKEKERQLAKQQPIVEDLTFLDSQSNIVGESNDSLKRSLENIENDETELNLGSQPDLASDEPLLKNSTSAKFSSTPVLANNRQSFDKLGDLLDKSIDIVADEELKTHAMIEKRDSIASISSISPLRKELHLKSQQIAPGPPEEEIFQMLNNPSIPEGIKAMMKALAEQNSALKDDLKSVSEAREEEIADLKQKADAFATYAKALEDENQLLNAELKATKIDGQMQALRDKAQESIENGADKTGEVKIVLPTVDFEVLGLLGRLKKIWRDLMQLYIETREVPDISPITDIDFILDQIDISVQILTSYVDTNVHEAQFPYVEKRHLNELESLAEDVKRKISIKANESEPSELAA